MKLAFSALEASGGIDVIAGNLVRLAFFDLPFPEQGCNISLPARRIEFCWRATRAPGPVAIRRDMPGDFLGLSFHSAGSPKSEKRMLLLAFAIILPILSTTFGTILIICLQFFDLSG